MFAAGPATFVHPTLPTGPLAGQRVLVTGATGFIGKPLCAALAGQGAQVVATTRTPPENLQALPVGIDWRCVDLRDAGLCASLVSDVRPDQIVHLASRVSGHRCVSLVAETFQTNLASTVQLMDAALRAGTRRFVTAGSLEEPDIGTTPSSPYAASKAASRMYAELFAGTGRIEVVHTQLAMIYGPGQRDATKLVPSVIDALLDGRSPEVSSGRRLADWTYIDDVIEALVRIASADAVLPGTIPVGTGELQSVRDVVDILVDIADSAHPATFGALADRPNEPAPKADLTVLQEAFDWAPTIGLADGLKRTWLDAVASRHRSAGAKAGVDDVDPAYASAGSTAHRAAMGRERLK